MTVWTTRGGEETQDLVPASRRRETGGISEDLRVDQDHLVDQDRLVAVIDQGHLVAVIDQDHLAGQDHLVTGDAHAECHLGGNLTTQSSHKFMSLASREARQLMILRKFSTPAVPFETL